MSVFIWRERVMRFEVSACGECCEIDRSIESLSVVVKHKLKWGGSHLEGFPHPEGNPGDPHPEGPSSWGTSSWGDPHPEESFILWMNFDSSPVRGKKAQHLIKRNMRSNDAHQAPIQESAHFLSEGRKLFGKRTAPTLFYINDFICIIFSSYKRFTESHI